MVVDIDKVKKTIGEIRRDLGEGFVATDIWAATDGKSLIYNYAGSNMYTWGMSSLPSRSKPGKSIGSYSGQPRVITLISEVTRKLDKTLVSSEYPGLGKYYLINLENNHLILVLSTASHQQFLLVDLSKTTMGILMSVALPKLLKCLN